MTAYENVELPMRILGKLVNKIIYYIRMIEKLKKELENY